MFPRVFFFVPGFDFFLVFFFFFFFAVVFFFAIFAAADFFRLLNYETVQAESCSGSGVISRQPVNENIISPL